jgi:hypothetical protein
MHARYAKKIKKVFKDIGIPLVGLAFFTPTQALTTFIASPPSITPTTSKLETARELPKALPFE